MTTATPTDRARAAAGMPAAEPPPGTSIAVRIAARIGDMQVMETEFQSAMPRGMEARQLIRDAATALRNVPQLVDCTRPSFLGALMTAAQLGLRPNVPSLGHGWVLPYENRRAGTVEAQFILGFQGMVELVERTGRVLSIEANTIYANERYRIVRGLNQVLEHEPIYKHDERGEPILHYAIARFTNGGVAWHVMGEDDIEEIKKSSRGAGSSYSPWNTNRDAMARKSAIRQLFKFLPKTTELAQAIASDGEIRTSLDRDAIGVESVIEHGPVAARAVEAGPGVADIPPPGGAEPSDDDARRDDGVPADRPDRPTTPKRAAMMTAIGDKFHLQIRDIVTATVGADIPMNRLTDRELQAVLATDLDVFNAAQAEARAEAQLAADVPEEPEDQP